MLCSGCMRPAFVCIPHVGSACCTHGHLLEQTDAGSTDERSCLILLPLMSALISSGMSTLSAMILPGFGMQLIRSLMTALCRRALRGHIDSGTGSRGRDGLQWLHDQCRLEPWRRPPSQLQYQGSQRCQVWEAAVPALPCYLL